jgi:hypothetical protein
MPGREADDARFVSSRCNAHFGGLSCLVGSTHLAALPDPEADIVSERAGWEAGKVKLV